MILFSKDAQMNEGVVIALERYIDGRTMEPDEEVFENQRLILG